MFEKSQEISEWLKSLQSEICNGIEEIDRQSKFNLEKWERPGGGGGVTRVISDGAIFEKGGVNFSHVFGDTPKFLFSDSEHAISDSVLSLGSQFSATGISIVIHPESPHVPIIHMNIRFFEMSNGTYWFGGGIDLTPHYYSEDQYSFFHSEIKKMCDLYDANFYPRFSKWADEYFFIKHRGETRGIGGIFFDRLTKTNNLSLETIESFWKATGKLFLPLYSQIVNAIKIKSYNSQEKNWQLLRRGRYVEFNLVYDKGTKFGLETSGRIESILMSLPKHASWLYDFTPEKGSEEEKTLLFLRGKSNQ